MVCQLFLEYYKAVYMAKPADYEDGNNDKQKNFSTDNDRLFTFEHTGFSRRLATLARAVSERFE
jgi:hypothetical protein